MSVSSKTVVITGGAGFIGSHLAEHFVKRGDKVICIDNFLTGTRNNLEHVKPDSRLRVIEHDVSCHINVDEDVHYVLHFASPASPADYQKYPIQTLKVGSLGTHNALGLALAKKATFLLASTSEVYGDPLVHPQNEDYWGNVNPIGPRGVYDEAKRFAEALTLAYHRHHGLDVKVARIFNTFGPRMRQNDGRAIPNFVTQALRGEPLTVFGTGSQTRSFCYIDDLVRGLEALMRARVHEPVNLGNSKEMTVLDLARLVIDVTGSSSAIVHSALPQDDPKVRQPDTARAIKILNWEPKVELRDGLLKTIVYFKSLINNSNRAMSPSE